MVYDMNKEIRFIKVYGYILTVFFVGCLYTTYVSSCIQNRSFYSYYFGNAISIWYLVTGIGILARKTWGYYLFKFFLYVLFLAFPIGTVVSYKSLAYMKKNDIKDLFDNNTRGKKGRC